MGTDSKMPGPSKHDKDAHEQSPLNKEGAKDGNTPKNFHWEERPYVPPPDIHFSGHDELPPEAEETCMPYVHFSIYEPESIFKVIADNTNQRALRQRAVNSA